MYAAKERAAGVARFEPALRPRRAPSGSRCSPSCAHGARRATSSCCTTSRRSTCGRRESSASRRSSAGTTRRAGCVPPGAFVAARRAHRPHRPLTAVVLDERAAPAARAGARRRCDARASRSTCRPEPARPRAARRGRALLRGTACRRRARARDHRERVMADPARAGERARAAERARRALAIDDFGTGYSSLAYLQRAADRRAQDRPLVRQRPDRGRPATRRSSARPIELAHNLGLERRRRGRRGRGDAARRCGGSAATSCRATTSRGRSPADEVDRRDRRLERLRGAGRRSA